MDNNELYNLPAPSIDATLGNNIPSMSQASQLAVQSANSTFDTGLESLSDSLKRISSMSLPPSFNDLYTPTLGAGLNGGQGGGLNLFSGNPGTGNSWEGDKIDLDQYYTRMGEDWANMEKGSGGATLAGVAAGAATGAAVGSLASPIGAAVGAVIGGILGGIEGNQVGQNVGYGYVRNKYGVNEQAEYDKQGFLGRAGAGTMNFIHSANRLTLGTLATVAYIPEAIANKSLSTLFDNDFAKMLDEYDKSSQSSNQIYHSQNYDKSSLLGKLGNSELWFEQVAPAVGFFVGALGVGRATGLGMGSIGLGGASVAGATRGVITSTAGAVIKGEAQALGKQTLINAFKTAIKKDLQAQTFKSMAGNLTTIVTSAAPESGMEAQGAMNESRENYVNSFKNAYGRVPSGEELKEFEKSNKDAANGVFAANLAVVGMSNWLQFGDLIGADKVIKKTFLDDAVNRVFGLGIKKTVGETSEKGLQSAVFEAVKRSKLQKIGYRSFKALESPIVEGFWEEGIQNVISGTQKNYLESRFNPYAAEINKSLIDSFGESLVHTYTSEEGWNSIMIGMIVGGAGTVRVKGGFDAFGQREASREIAGVKSNVENLNKTQQEFITAQEDYLSKQSLYNNLSNDYLNRMGDKIGGLNQQITNADMSKKELAEGNLEQAQTSYQNAVFAKLAAEKRAGLSSSNQFDMNMMVENIPDDVLQDIYNFKTPEEIADFKAETQKSLDSSREVFDISYELAETLNLGTKSQDFTSAQITEMAALNFFHGIQAVDNASKIGEAIQGAVKVGGIADALGYYANLSKIQQKRVMELDDLNNQVTDLESQHAELMTRFSTEVAKPVREPLNEGVVSMLDKINGQLESIQAQLDVANARRDSLTNILNSQESMPTLPFGNSASKFFDANNLNIADKEVGEVLTNLKSLDTYMGHLLDTTDKSEEDIKTDQNKVEMLQSMMAMYKAQMGLMRNFAKAAQMVADPAYLNNVSKSIFNSKKYDTLFDNQDWVDNNDSGLDELSKEAYKTIKEKLEAGVISKYDLHTHLTNFEIMRMGRNTQQLTSDVDSDVEVLPFDTIKDMIKENEDGSKTLDTSSDTYKGIFEDIAGILAAGQELSPNQKLIHTAILSNESEAERLNQRVNEIKAESEVTPTSLVTPDRNSQLAQDQRLAKIAEDKKKAINEKYDNLIDENAQSITERGDNLGGEEATLEDVLSGFESRQQELEAQRQTELEEVDSQLEEATTPKETKNKLIHTELDRLNDFVENLITELKSAAKELNTDVVDGFALKPSLVSKNFEEFQGLSQKGVRNEKEESRFQELKEIINKYGLVEGRVTDYNGVPIRLSDVLEQRAALENELFDPSDEFSSLLDTEQATITTEAPVEGFSNKTKGGDPSVLNNYDFATFTASNSNEDVSVANISPELMIFQILNGKEGGVVTVDNVEVELTDLNSQISQGQVVNLTFKDSEGEFKSISFQLDKSRRIIIPQTQLPLIEENSSFRFDSKNLIGSSGYFSLTMDNGGTQVPVRSDFDLASLIDSEAAQQLTPGDEITFEIQLDASYNKDLLEKLEPYSGINNQKDLEKLTPGLILATEAVENKKRSNVIKANIQTASEYIKTLEKLVDEANDEDVEDRVLHNKNVVYPLLAKIDKELANIEKLEKEDSELLNRNKELRTALNVDYNKISFDKIISGIEKKLAKNKLTDAQQKEADTVRKEVKDTMVITAKNKAGKIVGIMKSLTNSSGPSSLQMDYLRSSLFSDFEASGFTGAKTKFTVPVQLVYMGIPNISTQGEAKVMYEFSRDNTDNTVNPSKVTDIGYVTYGQVKFNSGTTYPNAYNYARVIAQDKMYSGRKIPVVVFNHAGKTVVYPITLKESISSEDILSQFDALEGNKTKDFSSYLTDMNDFLSTNGISPQYRFTSLNFNEDYVSQVRDVILGTEFLPSVEEFISSKNIGQTLMEMALVDINLSEKPFIGPKVRLDLKSVPEFNSDLLGTDNIINDDSPLKQELDEAVEDNECNIELD